MNLQWKAASGYVQGTGHIKWEEPCQDRTLHHHTEHVHAVVLADGAGSCPLSHIGAEVVTETLIQHAAEQFDRWYESEGTASLLEDLLLEAIDTKAIEHPGAVRMDFSCTLLFVVVKENRYLAGHIGDGVIVQRKNNNIFVLSHPENGRFINETYFITMAPLYEQFRIYKGELDTYTDFMIMSDGAAESFYVHASREIDFVNTTILFNHLVENEEECMDTELLDFLELLKEHTHDDCSIALLTSHTTDMIEEMEFDEEELEDDVGAAHELEEQEQPSEQEEKEQEQLPEEWASVERNEQEEQLAQTSVDEITEMEIDSSHSVEEDENDRLYEEIDHEELESTEQVDESDKAAAEKIALEEQTEEVSEGEQLQEETSANGETVIEKA